MTPTNGENKGEGVGNGEEGDGWDSVFLDREEKDEESEGLRICSYL